ncbi:hypothetical protein EXIGLDRAFT_723246 [Exidia glandulosa HHB12029]|uniref:DUF300-domain-containing protein n=1 Tax=Exidia glandulosa HHB12029 TaxID=1314781 RepID=A0A165EXA1_EXIGL|nr:hypothetical protein EXIGLDRAFT_723246 [Exidia glandulosa HHB12029]
MDAVGEVDTSASVAIASLSLALYDFGASYSSILTILVKFEYVWRKPLHSGSLLFLWVRYYGLFALLFRAVSVLSNRKVTGSSSTASTTTLRLLETSDVLGFVLIFSVQVVLQIRMHVMYDRSPTLALLSGSIFVIEIVVMMVLWSRQPVGSNTYPLYYVPMVLFEIWIGTLAFVKFIWRVRRSRRTGTGGDEDGGMVGVFFRDSAIHYALTIVGIIAFNVIGALSGKSLANSGLLEACFLLAGTRLILHLRAAYYRQQQREREDSAIELGREWVVRRHRDARTITRLGGTEVEAFWGAE